MGKMAKAILFDTRSIQRYIYSGNRLKTNIGASYMVDRVFRTHLAETLENVQPALSVDAESWREELPLEKLSQTRQCVFASEGGGNALILFSSDLDADELKAIVRRFSERVLVRCPGLHIGAAWGEMRLDGEFFQQDLHVLYKKLKEAQNQMFPMVNVPYTGLTLTCPVNGEAANYYDVTRTVAKVQSGGQVFYSQETAAKIKAAEAAMADLEERFPSICRRYAFPTKLEELRPSDSEKNYFAIVHIDGNNMGLRFRACKTQKERSALSIGVRKKTEGCFGRLLESIAQEYEEALFVQAQETDAGRKKPFLPIRPIILGGDDVTFVCCASMAIPYVKRFMELMLQEDSVPEVDVSAARRMDCCAGVAFLKVTYPFFRGYVLAEQLCEAAKQRMRSVAQEGTSWLDFALLHGEQAPTLRQIRAAEYTGAIGKDGGLHFGPYQVGNAASSSKDHRHDIENLLQAVREFQRGCMARSKAKELRSVLQRGKHEIEIFCRQLKQMNQHLPDIPAWSVFQEDGQYLWSRGETPYVDAVEMMDFLPKEGKRHER